MTSAVTRDHHQYRRLNNAEAGLELSTITSVDNDIALEASSRDDKSAGISPLQDEDGENTSRLKQNSSLSKLILSCTVAAGVQFGWALQLSLLTPYIQTLGIEHAFSSFIWLCGPITGFVVQPCVGVWSDKCHSKYGRRRPFILIGCLMISVAITLIGFSADVGYFLGDTEESCTVYKGPRWRAAAVFVLGFWMLDLANNTVQGPARALLADLSGPDQCNLANAIFCSWMAVGNILGFSSGASGDWQRWFPFLQTRACCNDCVNLKAAFLTAVVFLILCMTVTLYFAKEIPLEPNTALQLSDSSPLINDARLYQHGSTNSDLENSVNGKSSRSTIADSKSTANGMESKKNSTNGKNEDFNGPTFVLVNILTSLRHLPPSMHSVLLVMAFTWMSWFPFFLFDTDWMGREVYHGNPNVTGDQYEAYQAGVREGAFGLLLNSVVLGVCSFFVSPMCQKFGAKLVWAVSNFTIFICMTATTILSLLSASEKYAQDGIGGNKAIKVAALVIFSLLGFPLAVTYSVPFSVTAELTADSGGGQGLATGVLNLAIVVPQMIISLGVGPWDALFGGGNIPAFALASVFSLAAGVIALLKLPELSNSYASTGFHFG